MIFWIYLPDLNALSYFARFIAIRVPVKKLEGLKNEGAGKIFKCQKKKKRYVINFDIGGKFYEKPMKKEESWFADV